MLYLPPHPAWFPDTEQDGPAAYRRTGNQTIAPDVIPAAVFQLLQFGGGVGVHHPYGVFAVFGFQLIQQVDQAIRGNVSRFHLLQRTERTGFVAVAARG
jgi:hypothetical protein